MDQKGKTGNRKTQQASSLKGFTLIEVLAATAIFLLVFIGLAQVFEMSLDLITSVKAKTGAIALGEERLEFIKNLSYENVGTQGGIPSGAIPQTEVVSLNRMEYTRRTLIQYADDPSDGLGTLDDNGITADYKKVKVAVSWKVKGKGYSTFFVTNISPKGIETLSGGGTLRLQVFDATATPIPGASVHIENSSLNPVVDVDVTTNLSGEVIFPGSPSGSSYKVTVTKDGYSTAKTYDSNAQNPQPSPGHLTVAEGDVTTSSFQIDKLGGMNVNTYEAFADTSWQDTFDTASNIATSSGVSVASGKLSLQASAGVYGSVGAFMTTDISPEYLDHWNALGVDVILPANTSVLSRVYYENAGSYALVPDSDLPGNATGFSGASVDLSGLSPSTYRTLRIGGQLETTISSSTPSVANLTVSYNGGPVPVGDITFSISGEKTIGTTAGGQPIYKFSTSSATDSGGTHVFPELEWDNYHFGVDSSTGYTIAGVCPPEPVALLPGASVTADVILAPQTAHSLLVSVFDTSNKPLAGVTVTLSSASKGYSGTLRTTSCGEAFFSGIASGSDYDLSVVAGSASSTRENVEVSGVTETSMTLGV